MRVCVIFNPAAGRRRARRRLGRFLTTWGDRVTLRPTARPGHAAELAAAARGDGFDVVAAAGGDGTVHEVARGLLEGGGTAEELPRFAVVPVGSANDYAHSLARQFGATPLDAGRGHPVDVGRVSCARDGVRRSVCFVACLGTGLAGEVTRHARAIPRLQGLPLYGLAAWRAVRSAGTLAVWDVTADGVTDRRPTRSLSVLLGRREGNFLMAPDALLDDGLFDVVHVGGLGTFDLLRTLARTARRGPPSDHPHLALSRRRTLSVTAPHPLTVHADGELFLTPDDGVREITVELLPGALRAGVCVM